MICFANQVGCSILFHWKLFQGGGGCHNGFFLAKGNLNQKSLVKMGLQLKIAKNEANRSIFCMCPVEPYWVDHFVTAEITH